MELTKINAQKTSKWQHIGGCEIDSTQKFKCELWQRVASNWKYTYFKDYYYHLKYLGIVFLNLIKYLHFTFLMVTKTTLVRCLCLVFLPISSHLKHQISMLHSLLISNIQYLLLISYIQYLCFYIISMLPVHHWSSLPFSSQLWDHFVS